MAYTDVKIAGKYKLTRKIGSGSFGEIYLAHNIHTGEQIAAKIVSYS